ncbi:RNA polymerase factor sigma-54 [Helicobacter mustelae]|uniref:RNA polymerase sigma-54 factor n=1 Tax=Helicobacter mustelae (strain ATCC 43772 / CCUG 25715 / CIP 103759 / LMG 18044 / NCTC 12198 / R85-136P) TaxID=679897 RepID=D3UIJ6_HELM1|nr:RNA polymerase factor sigma-54 [Helicobacter mustelae]CBG40319.1 RNA polymerase sigma-54 factor [Helicobacter mustelae 12198]SQH71818.1 RNA polymerase sigma-54 factor [Helicobacter mustelae]STP12947.1 RNA polymerase sigma-54 factor [Helicobacter mustelae]
MAGPKLRQNLQVKGKLSATLKNWLPILQSNILEIEETIQEYALENPYLQIQSAITQDFSTRLKKPEGKSPIKNSIGDKIEALSIQEKGLYQVLEEQIIPPLFPTEISQKIALDVIDNINEEGYFDGDIEECAKNLEITPEEYERIRQRFCYLEPRGIGSKDITECFLFHLQDIEDISNELHDTAAQIIRDLENHTKYKKNSLYLEALDLIKTFQTPPALAFLEPDPCIIPDIFVLEENGEISVLLNDDYYPQVTIETLKVKENEQYLKTKLKDAKDLIDALDMRKQTLRKIGLMIVEYQYDFFMGGEIRPMKLKDLADEFGHSPSTISRAISNKFLECNRGVFPIKNFFTTAIDGDTSNASIKDFINNLIKNENKQKPFSDLKILELIEEKFSIKMVRRTITKYRKQLNIGSSSERKKNYSIGL